MQNVIQGSITISQPFLILRHITDSNSLVIMSLIKTYLHELQSQTQMNYTLKQLQDRVNSMIKEQGEDEECAAWIYTKEDIHLKDENGDFDYDTQVNDPALIARIFDDVGNNDYIYQVIQESVDEITEENLMSYQQELV